MYESLALEELTQSYLVECCVRVRFDPFLMLISWHTYHYPHVLPKISACTMVSFRIFMVVYDFSILPNILKNKIHLANITQRIFDFRSSQGSTELAVNNIVEISF